ncbi:MAG: DUF397 domain-containing protein [Stackebrandtia sp.]
MHISAWRKSTRTGNNGSCVDVGCVHDLGWRKSRRSTTNGNCLEVAGTHDAPWRKAEASVGNGNCVEVAPMATMVAIRDSKLDTTGDFPMLAVSATDWSGLLAAIQADRLIR